nr:uncharacterized protein LOC112579993 isoform X2 [Bubalus bubalis]
MLSCFLHPESPQGTTSGPMASWLATFIVYQSVRQHFSSARTNFHHFSNIKIFASLVFFRTFVSFSFFKKLYSSSLSTVQWKFYLLHFLYWFSLKFIRVFPLYFSEQLKKEIERKKDQFKSAWRDIPLYAGVYYHSILDRQATLSDCGFLCSFVRCRLEKRRVPDCKSDSGCSHCPSCPLPV